MAGAFGFARFPQRPSPSAQDVGAALIQRGAMNGPAGGQMGMSRDADGDMPAPPTATMMPDAAMRMQGAQKMGGPGQLDDAGQEEDGIHSANAINIAVGEALTRTGGGYSTSLNPFKDREKHIRQLQQLGLSAVEAQLLARTGGV